MFQRAKDLLALTATEQKVILFLSATFIIGAGIKFYTGATSENIGFDYRASDSTFTALSAAFNRDTASIRLSLKEAASPLNINTASLEELIQLPGIGSVTAKRILVFRQEHGKLTSLDELTAIKGISQKKLDKLRPLLRIR
ncbi:MAG: helix-hairpin-helix domain-containing protein [bacterium]